MFEKLAWAANLPDEPTPGEPLVEIIGNRQVLIENHNGVSEYGESLIRVKVKFGTICVSGCNLELARMTKGPLIISGLIESVKLNGG
jgi:sporulation protein YqfC